MNPRTKNDPRYSARNYLQIRSNLVAHLGPEGLRKELPQFLKRTSEDANVNAAFMEEIYQRYPNNMAAIHFASLAYNNEFLSSSPTVGEFRKILAKMDSQRSDKASKKRESGWPFFGWNPGYLIANLPKCVGQEFTYIPADTTFWASAWWNSSSLEQFITNAIGFFELSFEGRSSSVHEIRLRRDYHTIIERVAGIPDYLEKLEPVLTAACPDVPLNKLRGPLVESISTLQATSYAWGTYGFRTKFNEQPVDDSVLRVRSQFEIEVILEHTSRHPVLQGIGIIVLGVLLMPFWLPFRLAGKI